MNQAAVRVPAAIATRRARSEEEQSPNSAVEFLGEGRVCSVGASSVEVDIGAGTRVLARLALCFPYRPVEDDVLLVIGKDSGHFVIGVLVGRGQTSFAFQGAVDLRAQGGPLTLSSDHAVAVRGPEVEIEAGKLGLYAGAVIEKFASLYQRIRQRLHVHAGHAHTIVDESSSLTAKSASILTQETVSINGQQIHLG